MDMEPGIAPPAGGVFKGEPDENDINTIVLANMSVMHGNADEILGGSMEFAGNSDGNLEINTIGNLDVEENPDSTLILGAHTQVCEEEVTLDDVDYEVETLSEFDDPDYIIVQYNSNNEENRNEESQPSQEEEEEDSSNPCSICNRTFKTTASLKRHITVCHTQETKQEDPLAFELCYCCEEPLDTAHCTGEYSCDVCGKQFVWETSLMRHLNVEHNTSDQWKCAECPQSFLTQKELISHLQAHPITKAVSCNDCKRQFTRKYHLDRHLMQTGCDGTPKNKYECQVCKKIFSRKDNLRSHLRGHAGELKEKKLFTCQYCQKEFRGNGLLVVHLRTHTGERPYGCDICPKRFPSSGAMKKHRRMHTGERPYECKQCHKRFAAKETLNRHTRTHTGDRPHECHFCGKSFIQAAQLRAHIFHHTGEHAYICPHCNRAFNRRIRLTMHVKFVHEGAKPMECGQCDRTFFRKEDLARHSLLHSGEKPYECGVCHKKFAVKSSLKLHTLTHRKEQPCGCDECGRAFIRQDCLLRHMRAKHRDVLEDIMAGAEKKRLQQQLLTVATSATKEELLVDNPIWNELTLTDSIKELLNLLVDETTLRNFGWPDTPVDKLLDSVIRRCGHKPASEEDFDYIGRMRENAKLLFTVVIDDEAVKSLLNNQTVDEVILHVLKLARAD